MKSALFVWGGWDGHEPEACVQRFAPLLRERGFRVEVAATLDAFNDAKRLAALDLIVPCWTMGTLTGDQEGNLVGAVAGGVGIAGWHGGMGDAFRSNTTYQFMTGGQFVAHPGNFIDYRVTVADRSHPITRDIPDFDVHSEQYYMHFDPSNHVLATTTCPGVAGAEWTKGVAMPVAWTRTYGKGRVAYSALGHKASEFDHPQTRELTLRCLIWAARELG
jgi:type 1 glutamine amidotransferase